jgi:hypothetical protein
MRSPAPDLSRSEDCFRIPQRKRLVGNILPSYTVDQVYLEVGDCRGEN